MVFRTSLSMAEVFTRRVAKVSPWMILPESTSRPNASVNTSASNANSSLSCLFSLFVKMNRIGTNCGGLPGVSPGARSTASIADSRLSAYALLFTARRHFAAFRSFPSSGPVTHSLGATPCFKRLIPSSR